MAYNNVLETGYNALVPSLGTGFAGRSVDELLYYSLGTNGYTQATLLERLAAWAKANNVPTYRARETYLANPYSPLSLFAAGEQGVWYDPSDFTTMFQDAAGTTPVTAVEQPVGKILDKSGRGNHASQATATNRPVLSARKNLLTNTENFSDIAWMKTNVAIASGSTAGPERMADKVTANAGTFQATVQGGRGNLTAGEVLTLSAYVKKGTHAFVQLGTANFGAFGSVWRRAVFDLDAGVVAYNFGVTSPEIVSVGDGWWRISAKVTVTTTTAGASLFSAKLTTSGGTESTTWAGTESVYLWGAQVVSNDDINQYQRVTTATDYDSAGFPHYLVFDGVDDFLSTGRIDFTSTDKITNINGVYKSDDTARIIFELSSNSNYNNGAFYLVSGLNSGFTWGELSRGDATLSVGLVAGVSNAAPDLAVISATHDIAGDLSRLWRNGVKGTDGTADKGNGNFGNYPLYIGARGGGSTFFNGRIYGLIVRGAASTAQQIRDAEAWMNARTGAY